MSEVKPQSNIFEKIVGYVFGVPFIFLVLVLSSPIILYQVLVRGPIEYVRRKKFFNRNKGKILLCVTTSSKYAPFKANLLQLVKDVGIDDIVTFNCSIPNNSYDNYEWDRLINRDDGFPLLLKIENNELKQVSLRNDFHTFFKREIGLTQLMGSIKWKMAKNNEQHRNQNT